MCFVARETEMRPNRCSVGRYVAIAVETGTFPISLSEGTLAADKIDAVSERDDGVPTMYTNFVAPLR